MPDLLIARILAIRTTGGFFSMPYPLFCLFSVGEKNSAAACSEHVSFKRGMGGQKEDLSGFPCNPESLDRDE